MLEEQQDISEQNGRREADGVQDESRGRNGAGS